MPSATTLRPRSCARSMVERTMTDEVLLDDMSQTKDWSILMYSTGNCCR